MIKAKQTKKQTTLTNAGKINKSNPPKKDKQEMEVEEEEKTITPSSITTSVSLNSNDFSPLDDFVNGLGSWKDPLKNAIQAKSFQNLCNFLKTEYKTKKVIHPFENQLMYNQIYPPHELIFNAFKLTPINKVKVVVVGQDPYHQQGQAMGLSFSIPKGVKVPSSLLNIYKSIETDPKITNFKKPNHGDLTKWAQQGVFLLNTILTVEDSKPESHRKSGWDDFTDAVLNLINKECDNVVFMLWGLPAQKKAKIVNETK